MNLKFYKEDNRWYVDLPEYEGKKEDLEMVAGADVMLDIIAQGETETWCHLITDPMQVFRHPAKVFLKREMICSDEYWQLDSQGCPSSGAFYTPIFYPRMSDFSIWLCDVTKLVFGHFPEKIWIY